MLVTLAQVQPDRTGVPLSSPGLRRASSLAEVKSTASSSCSPSPQEALHQVKVEVDLQHYDGIDYEILEGSRSRWAWRSRFTRSSPRSPS